MANTHVSKDATDSVQSRSQLLQELSHDADSHDTKDQSSVLFRREVAEDSKKVYECRRLSDDIREAVRMRDGYINELTMSDSSDELPMTKDQFRKMHADLVQGLSLAFVDRHGVAELYGKLSSFEDERDVGIFMDERDSVDKDFFTYSCSYDNLYFN
ncbi:hypothetical protein Tco_0655406 [Tanacetum coccineum]|uniref:Uncharacterized protein n=1 Tax=Tanacetum coccineum TaxID=301880 RepID=A0ABQ4X686_9ASTR